MSFSDETINLVCERYRTEKFRFSWESGFSSSAGGVKECGGSPATTSTLCPTETSVGTGVGSLEAEDFGVMSLCPRAEQRFCARFAAGNEPPLVQADPRAGDKSRPHVSAGTCQLGELVAAGAAARGIILVLANTNMPTVVTASLGDPFTFYSP